MKFYVTSKISENIRETPEGFLVCVGVPIARTGEMIYGRTETPLEAGPDGTVIIDREESEVFRPETMASFEGKPVTVSHPDEFVNPDNWNDLAVGIVTNVRRGKEDQADDLLADLMITSAMAIGLVKNGLREVSCGYEADYIQMGKGRGTQRKLVGNHLALVDQGRAGSSYAINDHKPKGERNMKVSDKIKSIFAKAQDEALKAAVTDAEEVNPAPKEEKAKDAQQEMFDAMMNMCKDISSKMEKMMPKDASAPADPQTGAPAQPKAADVDPAAPGMEDRLKALEAAVSQIMEKISSQSADEGDDEGEEAESEDEEMEGETVGDTASRVEILAPGLKAEGKDAKAKALQAAYATADGKATIHLLTGGKAPDLKNAKVVDAVFIAASELLKSSRSEDLSVTKATTQKTRDFHSDAGTPKGAITAEQMNALNAAHYAKKA